MSQTSDVVWVEGPPSDSAVSAWDVLTYKVGDASGGFAKPVVSVPRRRDPSPPSFVVPH